MSLALDGAHSRRAARAAHAAGYGLLVHRVSVLAGDGSSGGDGGSLRRRDTVRLRHSRVWLGEVHLLRYLTGRQLCLLVVRLGREDGRGLVVLVRMLHLALGICRRRDGARRGAGILRCCLVRAGHVWRAVWVLGMRLLVLRRVRLHGRRHYV